MDEKRNRVRVTQVHPLEAKSEIRTFVTEVRLAIAEATMERFTRQIEPSGGSE